MNHAPSSASRRQYFTVSATSDSGLAVAITTSGNCNGSGARVASIRMGTGSGSCSIRYDQSGNSTYNAASRVTETTNLR